MRVLCLSAAALVAGSFSLTAAAAPGDVENRSDFWVKSAQFNYQEPGLMKEEGSILGLGISTTSSFTDHWQGKISTEVGFGELDYEGSTWAGDPVKTDTEDFWAQSSMTLGYQIPLDGAVIMPYAGLGGHLWAQEINSKTQDGQTVQGYTRDHTYLYLPVGVSFHTNVGDHVRLTLSGEYREVFYGKAGAGLEGVDDMDMSGGYGTAFTARADSLDYPVWGELYANRWSMPESDSTQMGDTGIYVYEPENETQEYGLRVGFSW